MKKMVSCRDIHILNNSLCMHKLTISSVTSIPVTNLIDQKILKIRIPMLDGSTKVYRVKLYDVGEAKYNVTKEDIGRNDASIEEVRSSHVFNDNPDDCDISMIVGEFPSSREKVLLNLRFHEEVESAEQFGSSFFEYAKDNISVGKGFKEVCFLSNVISLNLLM